MLPAKKYAQTTRFNRLTAENQTFAQSQQDFKQWLVQFQTMPVSSAKAFQDNKSRYIQWSLELKAVSGLADLVKSLRKHRETEPTLYPDSMILNQLIKKPRQLRQLSLAYETLQLTDRCGLADTISYITLIDAAGKSQDLALAKAVFQEAKDQGILC